MFTEHDIVILQRDIAAGSGVRWPGTPSNLIQRGSVGTVVAVYADAADRAYEVEFVDAFGSTLALLTLTDVDLAPTE